MDALDIRILRAMGPLPYCVRGNGADALRPARLAREIGVSPETVRDRIARLEEARVIGGYEVVPNLRHFGLTATAYLVRSPDEGQRDGLRSSLEHVEGLLEVTYFLGPEACVDLSYGTPGQRDRRLRAIAEAAGDPAPKPFLGWHMPPVPRDLTPLDWRILHAMRGHAKRSLVEVSEEIGIGYRTVKRHYDRMAAENSFYVKPLLDPTKEAGFVPFGMLFFFEPNAGPDVAHRIAREFDDHMVFAQPPTTAVCGNLDVMVFASSPAEIEAFRQRGARIPGVARVQALVLTDVEPRAEWLGELVEQRATAPPAASTRETGSPAS